jgi:hypothetical protein
MSLLSTDAMIASKLANLSQERTKDDKVLGLDNIDQVFKLIKKEVLTKEDILGILHLLNSSEIKLVNLTSQYERYLIGKYKVWMTEIVRLLLNLYEYNDYCKKRGIVINERSQIYCDQNIQKMTHIMRSMIDLYCYVIRSSLSVEGFLVKKMIEQKISVDTNNKQELTTKSEQKGFFSGGGQ